VLIVTPMQPLCLREAYDIACSNGEASCANHSGFDRGTHALTARGIDTFKPEAIPSEESPDC
jgi:hypothetical protein